jgi:hypothetical protein
LIAIGGPLGDRTRPVVRYVDHSGAKKLHARGGFLSACPPGAGEVPGCRNPTKDSGRIEGPHFSGEYRLPKRLYPRSCMKWWTGGSQSPYTRVLRHAPFSDK